jgi:hypothetical protein
VPYDKGLALTSSAAKSVASRQQSGRRTPASHEGDQTGRACSAGPRRRRRVSKRLTCRHVAHDS